MKKTYGYYQRFSNIDSRKIQGWEDIEPSKIFSGSALRSQPHTHALHYGKGIFEGIRAKPDNEKLKRGELEVAVLNLAESAARFSRSMTFHQFTYPTDPPHFLPADVKTVVKRKKKMGKEIYLGTTGDHIFTPEMYKERVLELVQMNHDRGHVNAAEGELYVRPLMFRGSHPDGNLGVYSAEHDIVFRLMVQEWPDYLPDGMTLIVYPQGVETPLRRTKSTANYSLGAVIKDWAKNFLTVDNIVSFDDGLLTDNRLNRNIEEATGANFFMFKDEKTLITPPTSQYILPGITRARTIEIARNLNMHVEEEDIPLEKLKRGKAAFLTGTATYQRSIALVYDPKTHTPFHFDHRYTSFQILKQEFINLISGLPVHKKNRDLQECVRSAVIQLEKR